MSDEEREHPRVCLLGCGTSLDRFWRIRDEREYDIYISINSAIKAVPERYNKKHFHLGNDGIHVINYWNVGLGEITWMTSEKKHLAKWIVKYPALLHYQLDKKIKGPYVGSGVQGWVLARDIHQRMGIERLDVYGWDFAEFEGVPELDKGNLSLDTTKKVHARKVGYFYAKSQLDHVLPYQVPKVLPFDYWELRKMYLNEEIRIKRTSESSHKKQLRGVAKVICQAPQSFRDVIQSKGFVELTDLFSPAADGGHARAVAGALERLRREEAKGV